MCPQTLQKTGSPGRGQSSPVIHQGVTVQLLVPIPCPGQFPLFISVPATPLYRVFGLFLSHLWRQQGQTLFGPSIYRPVGSEECGVL